MSSSKMSISNVRVGGSITQTSTADSVEMTLTGVTQGKWCTERVADHTDFVDCGKPVLRANRCPEHLQDEARALSGKIKEHESAIAGCRRRLAELNTEKG